MEEIGEDVPVTEEEMLLELYSELRSEVRMQIRLMNRSTARGVAVGGAIIGYALYATQPIFITLVPFIVGFLVVQVAQANIEVMMYARHMAEIESTLSESGSPFRYELVRGGAFGNRRGESDLQRALGLTWAAVPQWANIVMAVGIYVALVVGSVVEFWPASGVTVLGLQIGRGHLAAAYVLNTAVIFAAAASFLIIQWRLDEEVRGLR